MNEGSGLYAGDGSGNDITGILNGPVWVNGFAGKALSFDGYDDYVDLGNFDVSGNQMTLSAWIRADRYNHLTYEDVRIISKSVSQMDYENNWMLGTILTNRGTELRFRLITDGKPSTLTANGGTLRRECGSMLLRCIMEAI